MPACQHCGQGAIAKDVNGAVCPDCIDAGYYDDGKDDRPVWSPILQPEVFDEIKEQLHRYNGAFDKSVERLTINGVHFNRAPF